MLGLYPKLIFFAPQLLLIYFTLTSYSKRKNNEDIKTKNPLKQQHNSPSDPSMLSFTLATLFQPASDESPEYLRNLQNIQNTMGEFSDAYDWVMAQMDYLNWKDEEKTSRILQLLVVSMILLAIILSILPTRFIFLSTGLLMYAINTRFSKHVIKELQPFLLHFGKKKAKALSEWYDDLEKKLEQQDQLEEISVYENQRWWPRRGYLHEV